MKNVARFAKKLFGNTVARLISMILCLFILSIILCPAYLQFRHLMSVLVLCSFLGILAIGQTFVILTGGIDLSIAYSITFVACVFGTVLKVTGSSGLAVIVALIASILNGMFKGFGVAILKFPPMVMTLAASAVLMSATFLFTGGVLKGNSVDWLDTLVKGSVLGIRYVVLVWVVLGLLAIWILKRTGFGRSIYAIGSNARVAKLSGINTTKVLILTYIYESVMIGIAGLLLVGYIGYPNYTMGDGYQLISVACVVIGGTSIMGGQGGYLGTIGGVVIIYLIESILIVLNMAEAGRDIIYGALILLILLAYGRGKKLSQ